MKRFLAVLCILPILCFAACKAPVEKPATPQAATGSSADHSHIPTPVPETEPLGYCGNIQTTVTIYQDSAPTDESYTFMFGPSVTLTDLLRTLNYDPGNTCKCADYDIAVTTELGGPYYISFSEGYARCMNDEDFLAQANLNEEQIKTIRDIVADLQQGKYEYE